MTGEMDSSSFDYVIVGGGSAGCVVANRLSADPDYRVLLIEAGPDWEAGEEPEVIRDRGFRTIWLGEFYSSELTHTENGVEKPMRRPRLMGGGSSINGMHGQRGLARDYEEWRQLGVKGWGWEDVLPYFKRLETDLDMGETELHGGGGPVSVRRVPESKWSPLTLAAREALEKKLGLPRLADANAGYGADGGVGDGTMPITLSYTDEHRASSAISYLTKEVRARPNLAIRSRTQVAKILFEGKRAVGVELANGERIGAGVVFLCASTVHSAAVLLRSGVGPAQELRETGIDVVADRPGVGRHLIEHPSFTITSHIKRAGRQHDRSVRAPCTMIARYSSNVPGCQESDMQINIWERSPGPLQVEHDPMNRQLSWYMILLQKSYSEGFLRLDPSKPGGLEIQFNKLGDRRDLDRMVQAFRMAGEILSTPPVNELVNDSFIPNMVMGRPPNYLTAKLLTDTLQARVISRAGAFAMDYVPGMRARTMASAGVPIRELLAQSDDELGETLKRISGMGAHLAGTCRMGPADRPESVVDERGRVIGVEGVRVVDASIFPTMLNAGPNFPVMMAAEKISEAAIQDRRRESPQAYAAAS